MQCKYCQCEPMSLNGDCEYCSDDCLMRDKFCKYFGVSATDLDVFLSQKGGE